MDGAISSRSLEVGICGKCEAVGREGGSIAADPAGGRLCHGQVNWGRVLKLKIRRSIIVAPGRKRYAVLVMLHFHVN